MVEDDLNTRWTGRTELRNSWQHLLGAARRLKAKLLFCFKRVGNNLDLAIGVTGIQWVDAFIWPAESRRIAYASK